MWNVLLYCFGTWLHVSVSGDSQQRKSESKVAKSLDDDFCPGRPVTNKMRWSWQTRKEDCCCWTIWKRSCYLHKRKSKKSSMESWQEDCSSCLDTDTQQQWLSFQERKYTFAIFNWSDTLRVLPFEQYDGRVQCSLSWHQSPQFQPLITSQRDNDYSLLVGHTCSIPLTGCL